MCVCTYTNILLSKANRNAYVKNLPTHLPTNLRTYLPPNWTAHPPTDQPIYLPTDLFCNLPPTYRPISSFLPACWPAYPFYSTLSFTSFHRSFIPALLESITPWFQHSVTVIPSSFVLSFIHPFTHSLTQSLSHSVSQSLSQSVSHSNASHSSMALHFSSSRFLPSHSMQVNLDARQNPQI